MIIMNNHTKTNKTISPSSSTVKVLGDTKPLDVMALCERGNEEMANFRIGPR